MKLRFRLYRRSQSGRYYLQDNLTGKQESLGTTDLGEASKLCHARNEAMRQPELNVQLARAYLAAGNPEGLDRTWQFAMDELIRLKTGSTKQRYQRAYQGKAFDSLRRVPILQTQADDFLRVLRKDAVSVNDHLRRLHNFALDTGWLSRAILPRKQWPPIVYRERRGVTLEEHQKLLAQETKPEFKAFLELLWHLGGAQTDVAQLTAEDIDWEHRLVVYMRRKTGTVSRLQFGEGLAKLLQTLPAEGPLFPRLATLDQRRRGEMFLCRCRRANIAGITLHSYRYAWAERARIAGYPERFAQEALGHHSPAVHRAYAKGVQVTVPPLETYENRVNPVFLEDAGRTEREHPATRANREST